MTTIGDLLDSESHPKKLRELAIATAVWPDTPSLQAHDGARRLGYVEDVLAGLPVPVVSQKDRDAITAAAARIPEEG